MPFCGEIKQNRLTSARQNPVCNFISKLQINIMLTGFIWSLSMLSRMLAAETRNSSANCKIVDKNNKLLLLWQLWATVLMIMLASYVWTSLYRSSALFWWFWVLVFPLSISVIPPFNCTHTHTLMSNENFHTSPAVPEFVKCTMYMSVLYCTVRYHIFKMPFHATHCFWVSIYRGILGTVRGQKHWKASGAVGWIWEKKKGK